MPTNNTYCSIIFAKIKSFFQILQMFNICGKSVHILPGNAVFHYFINIILKKFFKLYIYGGIFNLFFIDIIAISRRDVL